MKGLYFQQNSPNEDITFVFQERENLPVTEENYVKLQVKACALSRINTKVPLFLFGRKSAESFAVYLVYKYIIMMTNF
ncbi:crystallin zeta like 1 [Phyllostomus discolor]|uniref:Crystallin zeta like 1 n=1 Tax=Phyllostomus discolor TaxID=89673 RepID=A0A834EIG6_9CHIR|nr:crystallin zeta like 1 [Phyllostomus discolor]